MSDNEQLFFAKELSWLSFNERVLQEAMDKTVPLIERIRFLGIFSSNQDEFFKVRVADVRRRILLNKVQGGDEDAQNLLSKIQYRINKQQKLFESSYNELLIALIRHNIFLVSETQLSDFHQQWLTSYFKSKLLRHISPILLTEKLNPGRFLKDDSTYLAIEIEYKDDFTYALIEVPTHARSRFIQLPAEGSKTKKTIIILDNIIRFCLAEIFKGLIPFDNLAGYSIKMTRDAEYDLSDELDLSLLEQMSSGLKQRLTGEPVRFVYDAEMPTDMIKFLKKKLGISTNDQIAGRGRYHNFKDFIGFPNVGRKYLEHPKLPALNCSAIAHHNTLFEAIKQQDILLHYPYHKYRNLTELIRQASYDPKVENIKINIYRVAKHSQIIHSLIDAANNGKKVTVVVELRARFDEEANILWAKHLTEAGVNVQFGVPSLKIHCKLCLIARREGKGTKLYAHLGTGNFHEKTAHIYTDFSLLTVDPKITKEVESVFLFLEKPYLRLKFQHLLVSPVDCRRKLNSMIDVEISNANQGLKAEIWIKANNLVDDDLIRRLYAASAAGVQIRLIIRGMCSLRAGVSDLSQNIQAISIVDRFLEHPRVFMFYAGGEEKTYISSADWMTRNLDARVEVSCPIYSPVIKAQLKAIFEMQFNDTAKARLLDSAQQNNYVNRGNRKKLRSQIETYYYLKHFEQQMAKDMNNRVC